MGSEKHKARLDDQKVMNKNVAAWVFDEAM